jgi:hypothetical protein
MDHLMTGRKAVRTATLEPRMIRAVPRRYAGVDFRSTLEADWAYTLDRLGMTWQYEPEAIMLPSGREYRPDFYLPELTTWLEVKGPHDERIELARELDRAVTHSSTCENVRWELPEGRIPRRALEAWLAALPDGSDQVVVLSGAIRHRVRRQVAIPFSYNLLAGLRLTSTCDSPDQHACGAPWRQVVVGRPATGGSLTWETSSPDDGTLVLACCDYCEEVGWTYRLGQMACRQCGRTFPISPRNYRESGPSGVRSLPWKSCPRTPHHDAHRAQDELDQLFPDRDRAPF